MKRLWVHGFLIALVPCTVAQTPPADPKSTDKTPAAETDPTSAYLAPTQTRAGAEPVTGSLYHVAPVPVQRTKGRVVNKTLESASLTAVPTVEPREFSKQDLITIVIRERSAATLSSTLDTEKDVRLDTAVDAFPKIAGGTLRPSNGPLPQLDIRTRNEFEGEADYERLDAVDIELQARVIDIKPNGNLVLEARKFIKNDKEELTVTVTGTARPDDITVGNRVLGTQLAQLRVNKVHEGELRKTTTKGLLTQVIEFLFNF
ncbi:MAG: flagellar basal body L-ring protein FlgH [Phycisphaeraceae bacterium]|nr:flagellar basal body L-ring protein FlgH [Phycisphaeraceae bacterium]